jgi:hypothetical protein
MVSGNELAFTLAKPNPAAGAMPFVAGMKGPSVWRLKQGSAEEIRFHASKNHDEKLEIPELGLPWPTANFVGSRGIFNGQECLELGRGPVYSFFYD